ncbi:MAG: cell wall-active antibiotics response protein [bacterium]|nr:cell wall-active antibiotics response protein [bacterium]
MDKKTSIFGIILVVIGALLLLSRFQIHLFQFILPAALIILGIWFIRKKQRSENSIPPPPGPIPNGPMGHPMPPPPPPPPPQPGFGGGWPSSGDSTASGTFTGTTQTGGSTAHGQSTGHAHTGGHAHTAGHQASTAYPQYEAGKVKYSKFLGDMFIDCQNINMQNIEISMFAGDLQINLNGGKLTPGLNRMIISGFLGDIMVFVPKGLPVFIHCSGFVGDLDLLGRRSDGFGNTLDAQTAEYDSAEAKLYVAVNNFVGDVRVYYV